MVFHEVYTVSTLATSGKREYYKAEIPPAYALPVYYPCTNKTYDTLHYRFVLLIFELNSYIMQLFFVWILLFTYTHDGHLFYYRRHLLTHSILKGI